MESDTELNSALKLPIFSVPSNRFMSIEHSYSWGAANSPLHTSVSVPFRWEEEPGKPRPCTALISVPNPGAGDGGPKSLELPPRLVVVESSSSSSSSSKLTRRASSPTTVLEGPYVGRSIFSSFRLPRRERLYGEISPERDQLRAMVLLGRKKHGGSVIGSLFGSLGHKTIRLNRTGQRKDAGEESFRFTSSSIDECYDEEVENDSNERAKTTGIARSGSFSRLSTPAKPHLWAAVYEGFKQVISGKGRKHKKERFLS